MSKKGSKSTEIETSYELPTKKDDNLLMRREGKRVIFEVGLFCQVLALIFFFVAYASSYWIVSWPRVHSGFKRIGLWEACFAGMVLETDPTQKAYHGCWWMLSPEYSPIRDWLMPSWFIYCQVAFTLCLVAKIVGLALMLFCWAYTGALQRDGRYSRRDRVPLLQSATAITVLDGIFMVITVIVFGACTYTDIQWLPMPYLNYLSWSYGLSVVSAFFTIFASIPQITYVMIIRQQLREPPRSVPASIYMPPGMAAARMY